MNAPANTPSAADGYLAEAPLITAHGLPAFTAEQAAKVAASPAGPYLLSAIQQGAWHLASANRAVSRHARLVAKHAAEVEEAIAGNLHVPGSVGGETWVTSSARDLQAAVADRKAAIEQIQSFTYAADRIVNA